MQPSLYEPFGRASPPHERPAVAKTLSQIGLTQAEIAKLPAAIRRKVEAAFGPANTANGTWMLVGAPTEAAASVFGTAIARVALVAGAHAAARQEKNIERLLELIVEDLPRSDGDLELELENAEMRAQYLAETKLLTALVEVCEFNPDSCGAGRHRGGLGYDLSYRLLEDAYVTPAIERTVAAPWGIAGGRDGTPNGASVKYPDGSERRVAKATAMRLPKGALFTVHAGGGAGYGPPGERPAEDVQRDLEGGYITEAHAQRHYPHVFECRFDQ